MQQQPINISDWHRILFGEVPPSFYLELIIRSAIIFLVLMFSMRFLGKRMSGLLGRNELVAMVSLAAAVGIPLTSPDRGVLPAFIIAFIVVFLARWISIRSLKDPEFDKYALGKMDVLIKNSVIDLDIIKKVRVSRERLVAQLRTSGVKHLGDVKRLYMEANGTFTLIKSNEPKPGLSVLPHWDDDINRRFKYHDDIMVCESCGSTVPQPIKADMNCPHCGNKSFTRAVTDK
jgi:uncharacterized membrane protein YcaP (DUF421 family)/predicted RNA-binding Zn-ribbon protein involved in translation (DUF1610 family)